MSNPLISNVWDKTPQMKLDKGGHFAAWGWCSASRVSIKRSFSQQGTVAGWWGTSFLEFVRAHPPHSDVERLARVAGERLPFRYSCLVISRDGRYLATSLVDGATTNIWVLPTAGGPMTPVTDFGDRSVLIVRSMSWSADSQHLYAAVAEIRPDIVLLDGLIGPLAGPATA